MRPSNVISVIGVLGVVACSHATAPAHQVPAPAPVHQDTSHAAAGRQQALPPDATPPKPYNQVITPGATTDSGVFTVHRSGEKLFYEIPEAMFGREFLLVADQRGTIRGVRYAGEEISKRIVVWERMGNKVFLRIVSYAMRADSTQPVARAVRLSNIAPIIMSFDVASWHQPDSNAVIEVTKLFTTDVAELNLRQSGVRVRRMDPARSVIERARAFPRNVEVSALQTFEVDSVPGPAGNPPNRSLNSITMLMNYSMVLLPDKPMMARLCDDRVGYFNLSFEDYDEDREPRGGVVLDPGGRRRSARPAAAAPRFADGPDAGLCGDARGRPQPGPAAQHGRVDLLSGRLAAEPVLHLPDEGYEPVDHGLRTLQLRGAAGRQRMSDAGHRALRLLRDQL